MIGIHFILRFVIITLIVISCKRSSEDFEKINIETVKTVSFDLITEIGQNDETNFGHLRDLVLLSERNLLVSDWDKLTIEQFSEDGEKIGTIAEQGRGPGELSVFFLLFDGGNDTLIVRHRGMTQQLDFFGISDNGVYKYARSFIKSMPDERHVSIIGAISDSEYLATASWRIQGFQSAVSKYSEENYLPVVIINKSEEIVEDSLHMIKTVNPLIEFEKESMLVVGMPPFQYRDRIRILEDGRYIIARPDSSSLYLYDSKHVIINKIKLNIKERIPTKRNLEYALKDFPSEYHNDLKVRVPTVKPPFLNIWFSSKYMLLYSDINEYGKEMIVLTMDAMPVGKFYISEYDEVRYFRDHRIYALHKNPEVGHSVRIYEVDIE